MPLKLVFKNVDSSANSFYTIYKIGDDLRQDMFVLQLINVMNQLWLMEGNKKKYILFAIVSCSRLNIFKIN
jgi:phosphatidylinositol kinase/protein kinase (PI-3  family)